MWTMNHTLNENTEGLIWQERKNRLTFLNKPLEYP